jgi:hypothetical protein
LARIRNLQWLQFSVGSTSTDPARDVARAWDTRLVIEPGNHPFNEIDGLRDPDSDLMKTLSVYAASFASPTT